MASWAAILTAMNTACRDGCGHTRGEVTNNIKRTEHAVDPRRETPGSPPEATYARAKFYMFKIADGKYTTVS